LPQSLRYSKTVTSHGFEPDPHNSTVVYTVVTATIVDNVMLCSCSMNWERNASGATLCLYKPLPLCQQCCNV